MIHSLKYELRKYPLFNLKNIATFLLLNVSFIFSCYADIWDYGIEGVYDMPCFNNPVPGKLIYLDVSIKGFYKNGEQLETHSNSFIIRKNSGNVYYLGRSFLKEIFGELYKYQAFTLWPAEIEEVSETSNNLSYLKLEDPSRRFYETIDFDIDKESISFHGYDSFRRLIWTESYYYYCYKTLRNDLTEEKTNYDDFIFAVGDDSIILKNPRNNSDEEKCYCSIGFTYTYHNQEWFHNYYYPTWDTSILDYDSFMFTELEFKVNTSDVVPVKKDITIQYETGIVSTTDNCRIEVYSLSGSKVAETFGSRLDISSLPKGVYIIYAQGTTLKVML